MSQVLPRTLQTDEPPFCPLSTGKNGKVGPRTDFMPFSWEREESENFQRPTSNVQVCCVPLPVFPASFLGRWKFNVGRWKFIFAAFPFLYFLLPSLDIGSSTFDVHADVHAVPSA